MRINLERNEYNTGTKLIFYENHISPCQAFNNVTCLLQETNKTKQNEKNNKIFFYIDR